MFEPHEIQYIDSGVVTPSDVTERIVTLRDSRNPTVGSFIDCAQAFLSFGMHGEAFAAYTDAVVRDENSVVALLGRAQAGYALLLLTENQDERGRLSAEVIKDFRRAIDLTSGENREAVLGLGATLLVVNRFAQCSDWIQQQLSDCPNRKHEGDLLYLYSLCRLYSGDLSQAVEYADKMDRVAGLDTERYFIRALVGLLGGERDEVIEYRAALQRRDAKFAQVLVTIESGAPCETFLDLARLLA